MCEKCVCVCVCVRVCEIVLSKFSSEFLSVKWFGWGSSSAPPRLRKKKDQPDRSTFGHKLLSSGTSPRAKLQCVVNLWPQLGPFEDCPPATDDPRVF